VSHGEKIHGYVVPPEDGAYTFWIRSYQGSDAVLLMNLVADSNSTADGDLTLIARQPSVPSYERLVHHHMLPTHT
jgi:hypothetical protein